MDSRIDPTQVDQQANTIAHPKTNAFGVHDSIRYGPRGAKTTTEPNHPLYQSELQRVQNTERMNMGVLKRVQGSHAPFKLQMERSVASKIQRLPGMYSHMVALDCLLGTDETIDFQDFLGDDKDSEMQVDIHASMEAKY